MRIFCFTGTGNSYAVAKTICKYFSIEPELITQYKERNAVKVNDLEIGIIAPVYLNDIPQTVKEFILKLSFTDTNAYIFTVLTSSSGKNKKGFKNVNIALAQHSAKLALAYDISMPSSFRERADMTSVLDAVPQKVADIIKAIEGKHDNYISRGSIVLPKNFTKVSVMYRPLTRMTVSEKCDGCGLCCKLCPTSNIEIQNAKAVRGKNCIACTACVNWCTQHAISNRLLKGHYHHPEISATDLLPV